MVRTTRLLIAVPFCFTLLVIWFAWSALHTAAPLAAENLRGAALSVSTAIEQLAVTDPTLRSLARYSTPDIAYFLLVDRQGIIRFHTNPGLIGQPAGEPGPESSTEGIFESRELLGTGEEVYLLRTRIHPDQTEHQLVVALHTYRADKVIRRARTGVTVVSALTVALWGLTLAILVMIRRSERHQQEMQRREELARLGEMGAVMAHEIRNPLASIKGFAQLLAGIDNLDQARIFGDRIVRQSLHMETLVSDLLCFAREDRGSRKRCDLSALLQDCLMMIRQELDPDQVSVLCPPHESLMIEAEPERIVQVLLNLLKNGLQAMPEGGELRIDLNKTHSSAVLKISDNGEGIPPESLPHIFEPFWTSKAKGTGLGLAICMKIMQEHGGKLAVESTVGVGTTFTATLQLAP